MKNILHRAFPIIALAGYFTLTGCFENFYTVKTNAGYESLETTMAGQEKEVIMHYTDEIVALASPAIDAEKINGKITPYHPEKPTYAEPEAGRRLQRYKYKHRETLFRQVHVYANIPRPCGTYMASVTKEQVIKYNTYKPAKGASVGSHVLGGVLTVAAAVFIGSLFTMIAGFGIYMPY